MVYLIRKLNQKQVILTFGQFDNLVIWISQFEHVHFDRWFFFTNHKMVFLTSQIRQKNWATKKLILKNRPKF